MIDHENLLLLLYLPGEVLYPLLLFLRCQISTRYEFDVSFEASNSILQRFYLFSGYMATLNQRSYMCDKFRGVVIVFVGEVYHTGEEASHIRDQEA